MKLILHSYRRCPFCIRTRIVLELRKIPHTIVEEPLRKWTKWMRENVEDKRVPQLRIVVAEGRERILAESNDINIYLDSTFGEPQFTPPQGSAEFKEMEEWWDWCTDVLKPQIDIYKYGRNLKFDKELNVKDTEDLLLLLQKIEERLESHEYLVGETLTLADIAIIPFIRQIMRTRGGEFEFEDVPKVEAWTKRIVESSWFLDDVMRKVPIVEE